MEWISPLRKYLETKASVSFACLRITSWKSVVKLLSFGEIGLIFLKSLSSQDLSLCLSTKFKTEVKVRPAVMTRTLEG